MMRRRQFLALGSAWGSALALPFLPDCATAGDRPVITRTPLQFIAALGDPAASSGTGAEAWGIWPVDPGPRGVWIRNFGKFEEWGGVAPAGWTFNPAEWWLEENGLIMEAPEFPLPPRKYLVTGGRSVRAILTVHPPDGAGVSRWELGDGATLHDVTHLGCRSARYTAQAAGASCTPANAPESAFRVAPGAAMPPVQGCAKQDYHVLFIIGVGPENSA